MNKSITVRQVFNAIILIFVITDAAASKVDKLFIYCQSITKCIKTVITDFLTSRTLICR